MKNIDSQRWDIYHQKTYLEDTNNSKYAEEREILFPRNCIIVDLGGGTGNDALYFLRKGHDVIILDISEFALNTAKERAKKEKLDQKLIVKQVDFGLHAIPIKPNSVDIAYSRISLNYFGREDTIRLFKDIYNILKIGGKAYLTFKSSEDLEEMQYLEKRASLYEPNVFIDNGQLRSRFEEDQLRSMLTEAGIKNYSVSSYDEILTGNKENHKNSLPANEVVFTKE